MNESEKQTFSEETCQKIAVFFKTHPDKDYCLATSEQGKEMCIWQSAAGAVMVALKEVHRVS